MRLMTTRRAAPRIRSSRSSAMRTQATAIHLLSRRHPSDLPVERMALQFRPYVNISNRFAGYLERLIAPEVEQRFSTAREALRALEKLDDSAPKAVSTKAASTQAASTKAVSTQAGSTVPIAFDTEGQAFNLITGEPTGQTTEVITRETTGQTTSQTPGTIQPTGKPPVRTSVGATIKRLLGQATALLFLLGLAWVVTWPITSCGSSTARSNGYKELVMTPLYDCAIATELLGDNIRIRRFGLQLGNTRTGEHVGPYNGNAAWAISVAGDDRWGRYRFRAMRKVRGQWVLDEAVLIVRREGSLRHDRYDLKSCL